MAANKFETNVAPNMDKIEKWLSQGATSKEVAKRLHISYETFREYRRRGEKGEEPYALLSAAFTEATKVPDDEVENALWKRACGIWYDEQTFETKWDATEECFREICTKRVRKYLPPDATSATFWLANRRSDRWKHKKELAEAEPGEHGVIVMAAAEKEPEPPPELVAAARLEDANGG